MPTDFPPKVERGRWGEREPLLRMTRRLLDVEGRLYAHEVIVLLSDGYLLRRLEFIGRRGEKTPLPRLNRGTWNERKHVRSTNWMYLRYEPEFPGANGRFMRFIPDPKVGTGVTVKQVTDAYEALGFHVEKVRRPKGR